MSDVHLEMERWRLNVPEWPAFMARHRSIARHPARGPMLNNAGPVDLVVLAGDIHNGFRGVVYADQVARYFGAPVVMIAGNHEFYHHDVTILLPALRAACGKTQGRVQFLENAVARFAFTDGPLNVLGCTLWTDYELNFTPDFSMFAAQSRMNDHAFIRLEGAAFAPADALRRHQASRRWLSQTLARLRAEDPAARNLVVTHHAPGGAYLGTRIGDIAPAYGSDLLEEFADLHPAGWIHGHTHFRHESVAHGIKVVSAPRGYVVYDGAAALQFAPGILVV